MRQERSRSKPRGKLNPDQPITLAKGMQHHEVCTGGMQRRGNSQRASLMQTWTTLSCVTEQRAVNVDNVFVTASALMGM